jgi:hypothetical protein
MRALHSALRRDLSRLQAVASQLDGSTPALPTVLACWGAFRSQLDNHHAAEDDDLWPVLCRKLTDPAQLAAVDAMVEEHRHIPAALANVDAALRAGGELMTPSSASRQVGPPGARGTRRASSPRAPPHPRSGARSC